MMRLIAMFLVFVIAGCGGGGSSGSGSDNGGGPPASNGSVGGTVSSVLTPAISGVSVALTGADSSAVATDATGEYVFAGLGAGTYTLTPTASGLTFDPASRTVTVSAQDASTANFVATFTSTQQIADFMAGRHVSMLSAFALSEAELASELAARGAYRSGEHYSRSGGSYIDSAQWFADDSIATAGVVAQSLPVESLAVVALLAVYAVQDAAFAETYYRSVNWGLLEPGLSEFLGDIKEHTNAIYLAAAQHVP